MLKIQTYLKEIKNKGIGLIAGQDIKKNSVIWVYNEQIDIVLNNKNLPKILKEFLEIYATKNNNKYMLCCDNARFMNHSLKPNIKSLGSFKDNIAIKNISKGEELTIDYNTIDEDPVDFKVI